MKYSAFIYNNFSVTSFEILRTSHVLEDFLNSYLDKAPPLTNSLIKSMEKEIQDFFIRGCVTEVDTGT